MRIPFTSYQITKNAPSPESVGASRLPFVMKNSGMFTSITKRPDFFCFFSAYEKHADVNAGIRELRQTVGSGGWMLKKGEDAAPDAAREELAAILNARQSERKLRERTIRDLAITGNAYWCLLMNQGGGRVVSIAVLDPRTVSIVADPHGEVKAYIQKVGMATVVFTPAEIIHFTSDTDTANEICGMSPLMAVHPDISADIEAATATITAMRNSALPAAVYILRDDIIDREQIDYAVKQIQAQFKGSSNIGKSQVMPDVKDIKQFAPDFAKLQFLDLRRFTTEKVCAALGVPKFLLGYTDTVNNNNGTELMRQYYTGTVRPWEQLYDETITRQLLPRIGGDGFSYESLPQEMNMAEVERRALEEWRAGALTLRQYKIKTGQEITPEDEQNPNFDAYILHAGGSARLLEDVGVEPVDTASPEAQENLLNALRAA